MTDQLRDQIAALFRSAPGAGRLGDEPPGTIADAVLEVVAPLLAERDSEIADLDARRARWALEHEKRRDEIDLLKWLHAEAVWQRGQAVMEEALRWRKIVEQWEQGHQNDVLSYTAKLEADLDLLLWLRAEAVWRLASERQQRWDHVLNLLNDTQHAEEENDVLRREIKRLRREVEFEALGSGPIVDGGYSRDNLRFPLCACLSAEQAAALDTRFSRPVCAVHPEAEGSDG